MDNDLYAEGAIIILHWIGWVWGFCTFVCNGFSFLFFIIEKMSEETEQEMMRLKDVLVHLGGQALREVKPPNLDIPQQTCGHPSTGFWKETEQVGVSYRAFTSFDAVDGVGPCCWPL